MKRLEKILISKKETATALGLSIRTIDYLIKRGELIPKRVGARVLFRRDELTRFAQDGAEGKGDT